MMGSIWRRTAFSFMVREPTVALSRAPYWRPPLCTVVGETEQ